MFFLRFLTDLHAKLGEFCETAHPGENTYARFDYDVTNTNKRWRCYTRESLTGDRARFNGSPSRFYTHHSGLTAIVEDYPSLKLEALLLTAKFHFPFDDPRDVHTAKDNSLKWSGVFLRRTAGTKDYAVSTNGELRTIFLFNDTGCISDPELCVQGLTVSFWLKHSNKEAGQTFLFTGATETADSRGLRVFQYNSSLDHVAIELRQKTRTCLWIYSAPENIWSHFVLSFDASIIIGTCSSLSFFFNGERQEPLYYDVESLVHAFVSPTAQVGDSSNGLPIASFDDLVIWYETFGDAVITQVYDCYKATFSTVTVRVEREIFTNQAASTFVDFERMESVTSSLISEIATLVGENNVSSVAVNKYEFANIGTKTHSAYLTVVFDQRSGAALDPLRAGTILSTNSWTVVDIQSNEDPLKPPENISVRVLGSSTVHVEWLPHPSPFVEGYFIQYTQVPLKDTVNFQQTNVTNPSVYLNGLTPLTNYSVALRTVTQCRNGSWSENLLVVTEQSGPSHPPVNVSGERLSSTSLFIYWAPVPLQHRGGLILGYNVSLWTPGNDSSTNITLTTEREEIPIKGLDKFTPYLVTVSAFNEFGDGVFSDPIEIWTDEDGRYKNTFKFIDLIESPGIAHVINTASYTEIGSHTLLAAVLGVWPIASVTMVTVCLAGVVIWILERKENAEQFKSSFIRGTGEGMWWSYISATTVGYGDRAPVTYSGRLFSVFWILMGLVVIGILNGSITTALTVLIVNLDASAFGNKVAAVQHTPEYRFGWRKNFKMDNATYASFREVFSALESGKVKHALFDTYAIGSEKALFEGAHHLEIHEIFDYSSTYGIVLGAESGVLQKCFNMFKKKNIRDIFEKIEGNIDSIKPGKDLAIEVSTGLFDISSSLFKTTLLYCSYALATAVVAGVIWEIR
ncbi:unnamed protein product, partial [Porites lobata]